MMHTTREECGWQEDRFLHTSISFEFPTSMDYVYNLFILDIPGQQKEAEQRWIQLRSQK